MCYLRVNFRLYPTEGQETKLIAHCDATRFVFNQLLADNIKQYETDKTFTFGMELVSKTTPLRKEHIFLKEVNSQSLQQAAHRLAIAFKNRFKNKSGFPKFKSKRNPRQSYNIPQNFSVNGNQIRLPKIGWIRMINDRALIGKAKSLTIIRDIDEWYVSILCEYEKPEEEIDQTSVVGIDVGIKTFAITSDGECLDMPKFTKENQRLKRLQRRLAKKQKGSKNRDKARKKLGKKYREISRKKKDFINKFVSTITKGYDIIVMEDLNIKGMKANRCLAPSIQQLPWYFLKKRLQEKAKSFIEADRWYPSSKTCSCCGWINKDLTLKDRDFICQSCNSEMDRDLNAAINLKNLAGGTPVSACGDTTIGDESNDSSRYVSMKQESFGGCLEIRKSVDCG